MKSAQITISCKNKVIYVISAQIVNSCKNNLIQLDLTKIFSSGNRNDICFAVRWRGKELFITCQAAPAACQHHNRGMCLFISGCSLCLIVYFYLVFVFSSLNNLTSFYTDVIFGSFQYLGHCGSEWISGLIEVP